MNQFNITYVNTGSKCSDELAGPRSLFRAFVAHICIVRTLMIIQAKNKTLLDPLDSCIAPSHGSFAS